MVRERSDLIGSLKKTSVYKYPKKTAGGRTFYYKSPLSTGGMQIDPEDFAKREKEIVKAYKDFVKTRGFNPNRGDIVKATGYNVDTVENILNKNKLKFTVGIRPDQFRGGPSKEFLKTIDPFPEGSAKQKSFIKDLKKQFKFPLNSAAAKEAGVLSKTELAKKHGITFKQASLQTEKYKDKLNLKYPKGEYEGKAYKKQKQKERRERIVKVSKPTEETKIAKAKGALTGKKFSRDPFKGIDQAHRASLKQLTKFNAPLLAQSLGLDVRVINSELIKPFETELEKLYNKQNKIVKRFKGREIPISAQREISKLNLKILDKVAETKGVLQGVLMNERTGGFASVQGINPRNTFGMGLLDDIPVRDLTPEQRAVGILNFPEQIKQQRGLGQQIRRALVGAASLTPAGRFARIARFLKKEGGMADEDMMVDIKSYDGLDRSTYPSNSMQREALFASPIEDPKPKKRSAILDLELV